MYDFEPRIPLDHGLTLGKKIMSGDIEISEGLILSGAIAGEIGAYLGSNNVSLGALESYKCKYPIDTCVAQLEQPGTLSAINHIAILLQIVALFRELIK